MIIPGIEETLRIIDGSKAHAAVRALEGLPDAIGIAAPALAYAADAIRSAPDGERQKLENELEALINRSREETGLGLFVDMPAVPILSFGRNEARAFPRVAAALGGGGLRTGVQMLQTVVIAQLREASLLLERTPENRAAATAFARAGVFFAPHWA